MWPPLLGIGQITLDKRRFYFLSSENPPSPQISWTATLKQTDIFPSEANFLGIVCGDK